METETPKYLNLPLQCPVIHDHTEQNSGVPCLFP